jgi:hypothetical protein
MDIVEVMEVRDGLIQHHRVYCGWYSVILYDELQRSKQLTTGVTGRAIAEG